MSPVVFHDDTLERVTHGTGRIGAWTLSSLQQLCLAAKHPLGTSFPAPVRIPHLEEFVKECLRLKMKMIMDLKTYEIPEETASVVTGLYQKYPEMRTCTLVTRDKMASPQIFPLVILLSYNRFLFLLHTRFILVRYRKSSNQVVSLMLIQNY